MVDPAERDKDKLQHHVAIGLRKPVWVLAARAMPLDELYQGELIHKDGIIKIAITRRTVFASMPGCIMIQGNHLIESHVS
ncbi:hypothetical protein MAM1_0352c09945 [Mucor ambiguus]|uniref:Uncharacterized protein n=1 Tax=Mucor ambiguus TaxID=91626 RepID=A0A0C9MSI6_9FUNG|nr:hypothetical protein MAM1_0352c09945 [Mucor ambiguus]